MQQKIIEMRYPNKTIEFPRPKTIQRDDTSCGPFVIAYATALIYGNDPKEVEFVLDDDGTGDISTKFRSLIYEMFVNYELKPFPLVGEYSTNEDTVAIKEISADTNKCTENDFPVGEDNANKYTEKKTKINTNL